MLDLCREFIVDFSLDNLSELIGICIGDGHLRPKEGSNKSCELTVKHCLDQEDYCAFKAKRVGLLLKKDIKLHYGSNDKNGKTYQNVNFSISHPILKIIYSVLYENKIKKICNVLSFLDAKSIAYWHMDDGSLTKKYRKGKLNAHRIYLSTYISQEENQIISNWFINKYGIKFTVGLNKGKYRLSCGSNNAKILSHLIRPYVVPCMAYKLLLT